LIAITSKQWITASLIFLFENPSFFSVFHAGVLCITSVYRGKFICQPEGRILGEQIGESPLFTFHGCTKHETMPRRFGNLKPLYTQKSRHQFGHTTVRIFPTENEGTKYNENFNNFALFDSH
jgi:hypothetical protein